MKIKTKITETKEVDIEIDVPEYFLSNYLMDWVMFRNGKFTTVFISSDKGFVDIQTSGKVDGSKLKSIKEITRSEFYAKFCEAMELMTGFKYEPESDAIKNNFSQADSEPNRMDDEMIAESEQFNL
jgi:hypothetical protein